MCWRLGVVVFGVLVLGCGEGHNSPDVTYCNAVCGDACGQTVSRDCVTNCLYTDKSAFNLEFLGLVGSCMQQLQCTNLSEAQNTCWETQLPNVKPSPVCETFCKSVASSVFECGGRQSIEDCLKGACGWSDSVLNDTAECFDKQACEDRTSCLDAIFKAAAPEEATK